MLNKIGPKLGQKFKFQKIQILIYIGLKQKVSRFLGSSGGSVEYTLTLKHRERYRRDMYHAS